MVGHNNYQCQQDGQNDLADVQAAMPHAVSADADAAEKAEKLRLNSMKVAQLRLEFDKWSVDEATKKTMRTAAKSIVVDKLLSLFRESKANRPIQSFFKPQPQLEPPETVTHVNEPAGEPEQASNPKRVRLL